MKKKIRICANYWIKTPIIRY